MKQLKSLLSNDWIELCFGAWGSSIVLAAKPHQEHVLDIEDFIWTMCVSYWKLNSVTKPPFMEMRLKLMRILYRKYLRKDIPLMAWSLQLIKLFQVIKRMITSSPLLVRYNPTKPAFLKTDWSASGMAWILMQPDDSPASQ